MADRYVDRTVETFARVAAMLRELRKWARDLAAETGELSPDGHHPILDAAEKTEAECLAYVLDYHEETPARGVALNPRNPRTPPGARRPEDR